MTKRLMMIDTGCAPSRDIINRFNLDVMQMKVFMDGRSSWDMKELDIERYYSEIVNTEDFYTNPPTLWDIYDKYEEIRDRGYEELIDIHFSSKMSQTINICNRAKKMVKGLDVKIIDTGSVSAGSYFVAEKVLELLDEGNSYSRIMEVLPEIQKSSYIQFSVPNVKYLLKNGRIGRAQAFAALVLKIKPILGVFDGVVAPISKEKGIERVFKKMADNSFKFLKKRRQNVKVSLIYGFDSNKQYIDTTYDIFLKKFKKLNISEPKVIKSRVLPTVACHSGPDVFGIAVYGEKKPI